jgi:uncharacterized protein Yka (UPF0111/DUF47 family)
MWLDKLIKKLLPREDHFFVLLERGARCAQDASSLLVRCVSTSDAATRDELRAQLKAVEHEADRVIIEVYKELNRTFVTPIDRSDIYKLGSELESITDAIYSVVLQISLHAMDDLPVGSLELAQLIERAATELVIAVGNLQNPKSHLEIRKSCKNIQSFEDRGDEVFRTQIASMFKNETDAIRLLKHKEFLEGLEAALDLCDDVGNVVSAIVIKNS